MNVIVANKYKKLLSNLNIDVIKNISGIFTVDDIAVQFKNFFYNKMILDITALEDYEDINTIQNLSVALDMNKVILLLDDSTTVNSDNYLSKLISMGIYNFTKNIDTIPYLMDNPNTYKDVASYHKLDNDNSTSSSESNSSGGIFSSRKEKNVHHKLNDYEDDDNSSKHSYYEEDNSYRQSEPLNNHYDDIEENSFHSDKKRAINGQRIIGIKNLTSHAGSTTLTYLMKKHLEGDYKVKAVEMERHDFKFFQDPSLMSLTVSEIKDYISHNNEAEVILIDIAEGEVEKYCTDVVYLIEPGLIQLNRLIREDNRIFEKLSNKIVVLNRSILSKDDIDDFEKESGSRVFFNMPNIDDKDLNNKVIKNFLSELGFTRIGSIVKKGINLFK